MKNCGRSGHGGQHAPSKIRGLFQAEQAGAEIQRRMERVLRAGRGHDFYGKPVLCAGYQPVLRIRESVVVTEQGDMRFALDIVSPDLARPADKDMGKRNPPTALLISKCNRELSERAGIKPRFGPGGRSCSPRVCTADAMAMADPLQNLIFTLGYASSEWAVHKSLPAKTGTPSLRKRQRLSGKSLLHGKVAAGIPLYPIRRASIGIVSDGCS